MRRQPRRLRRDRAVTVQDQVTPIAGKLRDAGEQLAGVGTRIGGVSVWEELTDVFGSHRPEQGVHEGVGDDVRVRVTQKPPRGVNAHATKDERATLSEGVHVKSVSYAQHYSLPPSVILGPRLWSYPLHHQANRCHSPPA